MVAIGDIVSVRQLPGQRFVVIGPVTNPAGPARRRWRVRRESAGGQLTGRTCGEGDLTVLAHPTFVPGQRVTFFGKEAEVVRDDSPTVRLKYVALRPRNLDRHNGFMRTPTVAIGAADVGRADLHEQVPDAPVLSKGSYYYPLAAAVAGVTPHQH